MPYANGPVHIGHLAGVYVPADIYVRYLRMRGRDVLFVCGSDEHGVPITIKARREGCGPQDIVDRYHKIIRDSFSGLGINFDIYSRTSSVTHCANASAFFRKLYDEGKFIKKESEQYYDEEAGTFLADRYIVGTCPKCGNENAYGDQCEKCGCTLSPDELVAPHSALSGSPLVKRPTSHWYLPLNEYEAWLREWILEGHREWKSNVYGQCKSWLDGGLQPRAVSRDLEWGVPVPVEGAAGKVLYVWFDAPIGYISNTQELLPSSWEKWWKSEDTELIHFIGKDNIVFHCIVFPSMLKAYGGYVLPENVPANEFLNLEGDKISTSRGWAVWLNEYLEEFRGQEDVLRYVLCANAPETKDNDFTWKDFQARNNNELVAVFGNFVNRAVVLTHKYFGGIVPEAGEMEAVDSEALAAILPLKEALGESLERFRFRDAVKAAMDMARVGNKYLTDTEPWKAAKTDPGRCGTILNVALQICADLAVAFEPFLPLTCGRLREILNVGFFAGYDHRAGEEGSVRTNMFAEGDGVAVHTRHFGEACGCGSEGSGCGGEGLRCGGEAAGPVLSWDTLGTRALPSGHRIGEPVLLFSKIDDSVVEAQVRKLEGMRAAKAGEASVEASGSAGGVTSVGTSVEASGSAGDGASGVLPQKEEVSFEDYGRMDVRVATVLAAERVPKTDKLLKLTIDTGIDTRVIVSGIAKFYAPEDMVGRQICILANLTPKKIRGIESKGMILMARQGDGTMSLVSPERTVGNGSDVG